MLVTATFVPRFNSSCQRHPQCVKIRSAYPARFSPQRLRRPLGSGCAEASLNSAPEPPACKSWMENRGSHLDILTFFSTYQHDGRQSQTGRFLLDGCSRTLEVCYCVKLLG